MRGRPVRDTESVDVTTPPGGDGIGLAEAMAEAARALNAPETLEEVLERLVRAACTAIPGVDYAGVSIARQTGIETKAATDPIVEEADQLQYHLGEGPCLDAMAGQQEAVVRDMRTERRWPRFAPRAVELGVLSQMGIEIFRQGSTTPSTSTQPSATSPASRRTATSGSATSRRPSSTSWPNGDTPISRGLVGGWWEGCRCIAPSQRERIA